MHKKIVADLFKKFTPNHRTSYNNLVSMFYFYIGIKLTKGKIAEYPIDSRQSYFITKHLIPILIKCLHYPQKNQYDHSKEAAKILIDMSTNAGLRDAVYSEIENITAQRERCLPNGRVIVNDLKSILHAFEILFHISENKMSVLCLISEAANTTHKTIKSDLEKLKKDLESLLIKQANTKAI